MKKFKMNIIDQLLEDMWIPSENEPIVKKN